MENDPIDSCWPEVPEDPREITQYNFGAPLIVGVDPGDSQGTYHVGFSALTPTMTRIRAAGQALANLIPDPRGVALLGRAVTVDFRTLSWDDFTESSPPYSIALDGYVRGGPRFDPKTPRANFNHHEDVDRLATRSTCAQVLMAIRQGLFGTFRTEEGPSVHVWVNDCDEDVCTSWTLLRHHYLAEGAINPLLNRLVSMEDALDCTAGAYPYPKDLPALQELAWVFQPYRQFRLNGGLDRKEAPAYREVITDVEHRILQHVTGKGRTLPLDTRYEKIGGGQGWTMVKEIGAQARTGMLSDGIRVFVSVRERSDGRYGYVIGKMAPFLPIDLEALTQALNAREEAPADLWGGGDTIIGSPRNNGSKVTPSELGALLDKALRPSCI